MIKSKAKQMLCFADDLKSCMHPNDSQGSFQSTIFCYFFFFTIYRLVEWLSVKGNVPNNFDSSVDSMCVFVCTIIIHNLIEAKFFLWFLFIFFLTLSTMQILFNLFHHAFFCCIVFKMQTEQFFLLWNLQLCGLSFAYVSGVPFLYL